MRSVTAGTRHIAHVLTTMDGAADCVRGCKRRLRASAPLDEPGIIDVLCRKQTSVSPFRSPP